MSVFRYIRLTVGIPAKLRDAVVELACDLETLGIREEERGEALHFEVFFPPELTPGQLLQEFTERAQARGLELEDPEIALLEDHPEDWIRNWKAGFQGFEIGGCFWVHPSWEGGSPHHPVNLIIEPGHAFGTGTHESTQLCLLAFRECLPRARSLLDVGTGSGILSIAAALLRPGLPIVALDNDSLAGAMARENLERNGVDGVALVVGECACLRCPFDLVVANLTLAIIRRSAEDLIRVTGRELLLSGFIREQEEAILDCFQKTDPIRVAGRWEKNEWVCLLLRLPGPSRPENNAPAV